MTAEGVIETFRGDDLFLSFPKFLIRHPRFCFFFGFSIAFGPRLKDCRGDGLEETSPSPLPASSLNRPSPSEGFSFRHA